MVRESIRSFEGWSLVQVGVILEKEHVKIYI